MALKDFPLFFGGSSRFVEYLFWDFELADVVEQCSPAQPVHVLFIEAEFDSDDFAVCADSFHVPACESVVFVECGDEFDRSASGLSLVGRQRDRLFLELLC